MDIEPDQWVIPDEEELVRFLRMTDFGEAQSLDQNDGSLSKALVLRMTMYPPGEPDALTTVNLILTPEQLGMLCTTGLKFLLEEGFVPDE